MPSGASTGSSKRSSSATAIRTPGSGRASRKAVENVRTRDRAGADRARRRGSESGRHHPHRARRDAEQGSSRRERDPRRVARDGEGGRRAGGRAALPLGRRRGRARPAGADDERRQRRRPRRQLARPPGVHDRPGRRRDVLGGAAPRRRGLPHAEEAARGRGHLDGGRRRGRVRARLSPRARTRSSAIVEAIDRAGHGRPGRRSRSTPR